MKGKGITLATLLDTGLESECMCINHSSLDLPLASSTVWATFWRCGPFCDLQTHTHPYWEPPLALLMTIKRLLVYSSDWRDCGGGGGGGGASWDHITSRIQIWAFVGVFVTGSLAVGL